MGIGFKFPLHLDNEVHDGLVIIVLDCGVVNRKVRVQIRARAEMFFDISASQVFSSQSSCYELIDRMLLEGK